MDERQVYLLSFVARAPDGHEYGQQATVTPSRGENGVLYDIGTAAQLGHQASLAFREYEEQHDLPFPEDWDVSVTVIEVPESEEEEE